jgi:hypothetical protein
LTLQELFFFRPLEHIKEALRVAHHRVAPVVMTRKGKHIRVAGDVRLDVLGHHLLGAADGLTFEFDVTLQKLPNDGPWITNKVFRMDHQLRRAQCLGQILDRIDMKFFARLGFADHSLGIAGLLGQLHLRPAPLLAKKPDKIAITHIRPGQLRRVFPRHRSAFLQDELPAFRLRSGRARENPLC